MAAKLRHECERCGLVATIERAGRFRDQDFYELLQEHFALEQHAQTYRHYAEAKIAGLQARIDDMRELLNMLPDPVPEVKFADEENPFP